MTERFDDKPQWYWAVDNGQASADNFERADDRFVVACGKRELWDRVRSLIDQDGRCAWRAFGPETGKPTLADCMFVFLFARECYGVLFNRLVLEFSQVPAFAQMIYQSNVNLCDWVSNPLKPVPLLRPEYDQKIADQVVARIKATLNLRDDDWEY